MEFDDKTVLVTAMVATVTVSAAATAEAAL